MKVAVVCASNMNRSMETHHVLMYHLYGVFIVRKKGINVSSYGTNSMVKLPGPSVEKPNVYPFGTPYEFMYNDLMTKDAHLYMQNGILHMLERNKSIKTSPERFQECKDKFDVVFSCEERCFEIICEEYSNRSSVCYSSDPQGYSSIIPKPVYVISLEIKDTQEDATVGARSILQIAQLLQPVLEVPRIGQVDVPTMDSTIFSCQEKYPELNICYGVFFN